MRVSNDLFTLIISTIHQNLWVLAAHHWCELSFMDELFSQHLPMLRFDDLDVSHVYKWVQFDSRTESTDVFNVPSTFLLSWFQFMYVLFLAWIWISLRFWHILSVRLSCFSVGWFEFCVVLQGSFNQRWKLCHYLFTWGRVNVDRDLHFCPAVPLTCVFPD